MMNKVGGSSFGVSLMSLLSRLRLLIFGSPLATSVQLEHRLPIFLALPVFASDAISSVAYGPEEILKELSKTLFPNGLPPFSYLIPISIAIAVLMLIVATSYRRAVKLYPTSGGSYTVAKSNLGPFIGLLAAAALLIDYILTVAVSVSSGVDALVSADHQLLPWKVAISIALVLFIALVNLRGTRESGWWFALPLYSFAFAVGAMILTSLFHYLIGHGSVPIIGSVADPSSPLHLPAQILKPQLGATLGLLLVLRAFSNGCSAMTGVEAVSNGVSAFQPPEPKNAAKTLLILVCILVFLFLGTSFAAHIYHAQPSSAETILSQVTRATFGCHLLYYITQFATLAILMVAANTSYADFPRLLAFVARDGYAPKTFVTQGDRLVYNRGIIALTTITIVLIIVFNADVSRLIGLYSIGVFLCFTLSQLGMAKKIRTMQEKNWVNGFVVNLIGAFTTGVVTLVVAISKAGEGAWIVLVLIPIIMYIAYTIRHHYDWFEKTMTLQPSDYRLLSEPAEPLTVLVLVSSDVHRGILEGLECGRAIAEGNPNNILRAIHIEMDPEKTPRLLSKWAQYVEPALGSKIKLDVIPSPYRWLVEPIMDYLDLTDLERTGDRVIIVLPEFETGSIITHFLHNFTGRRLRAALLNRPNVTVVSSRFFMRPMDWRIGHSGMVTNGANGHS